ncbi:hypothetical protein DIPPA_30946 [Diplonema papillatum]|nr:hypothetical protein DIPPA_30946 [Diplonema papillatum]
MLASRVPALSTLCVGLSAVLLKMKMDKAATATQPRKRLTFEKTSDALDVEARADKAVNDWCF